MPSIKYTTPILQGRVYHIFNRGINHQDVFLCDADKATFLRKVKQYLSGYAAVLSYCVLDNHYHLMVMILEDPDPASNFSKQFGKLILSYTHYFNKRYGHSGPIFHRRFKRLLVLKEEYLRNLFWYINTNPMHHGIDVDATSYKFSSIGVFVAHSRDDLIAHDLALAMFPTLGFLEEYLRERVELIDIKGLIME
ncbi:MAG: hypothetical protein IH594_19655 [Bacteroidales bacterium]|nr:hypothetical protein [Bacteroidales bacterium]